MVIASGARQGIPIIPDPCSFYFFDWSGLLDNFLAEQAEQDTLTVSVPS